jgi:hypothetical protein
MARRLRPLLAAFSGNRAGLEFSPGVADDEVGELLLTLSRHPVEEM